MPDMDRFEYEKTMNALRNSGLDDSTKYDAMYEVEKEFKRQEWIRNNNAEVERQFSSRSSSKSTNTTPPGDGCCIIALMCVFTGLASVGFAKSLSDNAQVKQPEPQPATLVSKSNVTPTAHKNLIGEHIKN